MTQYHLIELADELVEFTEDRLRSPMDRFTALAMAAIQYGKVEMGLTKDQVAERLADLYDICNLPD